jgi:acetyltransferase-like isoleucine patch superfamily enzyme
MLERLTLLYGRLDRLIGRRMNALRLARLRLLGARVGRDVRVYGRFVVHGDARLLAIGDRTTINEGVLFDLREPITIGRAVRLSTFVQLHTSKIDLAAGDGRHAGAPIVIEDEAWLAGGVVVSPGVRVGRGAVVGANAVVTRDVAPGAFAVGAPARPVRSVRADGIAA